jgi:hypothetical protein
VISYYTSRMSRDLIVAGHQQITREWWDTILPRCSPCIFATVMEEIERGDRSASRERLQAVHGMPLLQITVEAVELANTYRRQIDIPEQCRADSYHLALASWHAIDYLVTWNCRHIASAKARRAVAMINSLRGMRTPEICTPEELMEI